VQKLFKFGRRFSVFVIVVLVVKRPRHSLLRQSIEPEKIAPRLIEQSDEDEPVAAVAPKNEVAQKTTKAEQAAKRNKKKFEMTF
jgi:hypothetical protein